MVLTAVVFLGLLFALFKPLRSGFGALHAALLLLFAGAHMLWRYDVPTFSSVAVEHVLWMHLLVIQLVTFAAYGRDKYISQHGGAWRVPERVLHGLAFAGGTPAAFLAQKFFRHKTKKQSFRNFFWLVFVIQIGLIIVLKRFVG